MAQIADKGLTGRLLPESYAYVATPNDAQRVLEIIDLEQADLAKLSSTPIEIRKAKLREMVLAEARALFPKTDPQSFRLLKLDERDLPLSGIRNESGFRLVNIDAIKRGDGMNGELVTVIFARTSRDRDTLVPLVFAHADRDRNGPKLKAKVDNYCEELYGAKPDAMVRGTTYQMAQRLLEKLDQAKDTIWGHRKDILIAATIVTLIAGAGKGLFAANASVRRRDEMRQIAWKNELPERVEFVKAQLASMKQTRSTEAQARLLDSINLEHYDSLAQAMTDQPLEQRVEMAKLIKDLVSMELTTKRTDGRVNYTAGPNFNPRGWDIRMDKGADRQAYLSGYINTILLKEYNPEVRAPLLRAMDEVASSYFPR